LPHTLPGPGIASKRGCKGRSKGGGAWTWVRLVSAGNRGRLGRLNWEEREHEPQIVCSKSGPTTAFIDMGQQNEHNPGRRTRATSAMLQDVVTMFRTQPLEFDYWVEEGMVSGKIPEELKGTYFRNGPGLQIGHERYQRHYLDGDGCVLSLAFPGGGRMPRFSNKYVRTKGFMAEQEAGRPLYRNAFTRGAADGSSLFNPLDLSFKNVANTGVLYWAERLWALWEVGRPYELNPRTLDTLGESNMDGQIGQRLAGHYRVVREPSGQLRCVCFGTLVTISGTEIEFYEFDEAGKVVVKSRQSLQGFDIMPIHDMLVTDHWYIVLLGPVKFDVLRLLSDYATSKCSLAELMEFDSSLPSKIMLFPRPGKFGPASSSASSSTRGSPASANSESSVNAVVQHNDGTITVSRELRVSPSPGPVRNSSGRGSSSSSSSSSSSINSDKGQKITLDKASTGRTSGHTGSDKTRASAQAASSPSAGYVSLSREGSSYEDYGLGASSSSTSSSSVNSSAVHGGVGGSHSSARSNLVSTIRSSGWHAPLQDTLPQTSMPPSPSASPHAAAAASHSVNHASSAGGSGGASGGGDGAAAAAARGGGNRPDHVMYSLDLPPPRVVQGPSFFSFHHVNAYEVQGGGQIVMDTIGWQDLKVEVTQHNVTEDFFSSGSRSHLHRLLIDVPTARILSCTRLLRRTLEFPTMNLASTAQAHRHAYFASDDVDDEVAWAPAQVLLKVTLPHTEGQQQQSKQSSALHIGSNGSDHGTSSSMDISSTGSDSSYSSSVESISGVSSRSESSSSSSDTRRGAHDSDSSGLVQLDTAGPQQPPCRQLQWCQQQQWCRQLGEGDASRASGVVTAEWRPGERCFVQEPLFVPRAGSDGAEDEGWIIVAVHNAATLRGEVAILDAQRIEDGPVATIRLPHALPYGLHGTWAYEYLGPDPEDPSVPQWREPNRVREL